jgi:hypothetical protein
MDTSKAVRNPDSDTLKALIATSKHRAARRIVDERTGDAWYWPAELGTHREGADALQLAYARPPGAGDIVTLD